MIHIYYGDGKGKTTAACGLAVRSIGQGQKVLISQFLKNANSGEIATFKKLGVQLLHTDYPVTFTWKMNEEQLEKTKLAMQNLLDKVIEQSKNADLVIMDEVLYVYMYDMIDRNKLLDFLKSAKQEIVLTGRVKPDEKLLELADYVSEIKKIKHPFDKGILQRRGVEF